VSSSEPSDTGAELPGRSAVALVLEHHAVARLGFGLLLRAQPWVERCLLSGDRDEAAAIARRAKPDVAIVDVTDAGPFLGSFVAPLRQAHPGMALLLSTRDSSPSAAGAPLPPGVAWLLTPGLSVEAVLRSVRLALTEAPPQPAQPLRQTTPELELSGREREVLAFLSTGATNREIAAELHVSSETVKKHAAALYRKLGVRNRTEAAQFAPDPAG
jgi:DNA-binding NarL/FixJ family response regulator